MNKKTIIEAVGFILWVVTILTLVCVLYEVKELKELTKNASNFRSITYRKQNMMYNRDKNKNRRNWRELMYKINSNPIIAKIMAENKKTDKNRIGMYYQTMYKDKDFDAECSFNRIQYRVDSISINTISK